MNERFQKYLQEAFEFSDKELSQLSEALGKPLKKSIRVNTSKISVKDFEKRAKSQGWTLTKTEVPEVFYIDREDTSTPLGSTAEHLLGYFYIQEVAASTAVHELRNVAKKPEIILDMSASPGGKSTQLAEYFSDSLIIANELEKTRLPQLFTNLDRMGHPNVCVTNYDGRFFQNHPEVFDAVLLDAPCSGEGTAFKNQDVLKNWHIKNIRRIAKLQSQLFRSAATTLKTGGSMVYSTCTLNQLENEGVIEKSLEKTDANIKSLNQERSWPHQTGTGGFFVSSFLKESSEEIEPSLKKHVENNIKPASRKQIDIVTDSLKNHLNTNEIPGHLYSFKDEIYLCSHDFSDLLERFYFYKIGTTIGKIKNGEFHPNHQLGFIIPGKAESLGISEDQVNTYLSGLEVKTSPGDEKVRIGRRMKDGYYQVDFNNLNLGLAKVDLGEILHLIPNKLLRK